MVDMKKKLIIHIGTPKTGTSFLQEVCVKNHAKLLASGVLYPGVRDNRFTKDANEPINGSHILSYFSHDLDSSSLKNLIIKDLISVFNFNVNTVLISDETFSAFNVLNEGNYFIFKCLIESCKSLDIELSFIAYYRRPSKYLPSHWAQLVKKHKETRSLIEFVEQDKIPYWKNIILLHKLYNKVSIYSYDKEILVENGISQSFFNKLGVSCSNFDLLINETINPALSLNSLTALRLINAEFEDDVISSIENILTNSKAKYIFSKARLTNEMELFVDQLYESELSSLNTITNYDV